MSLDCGKSQVELRGASPALPETGWTVEQCELYRLSALWNPETCRDTVELETELSNLCALHPLQPMLQLLQCNIGLCIYCRARALGRVMSRQSLDPIVDIARRSLDTVNELVQASSPWWHILNMAFQIVYILLIITLYPTNRKGNHITSFARCFSNQSPGIFHCSRLVEIATFCLNGRDSDSGRSVFGSHDACLNDRVTSAGIDAC